MVRPNKLLSTKITDGYKYTVNLESCKAANIFDSVFHLRESTMEPNLPKHFEKCECKNSFSNHKLQSIRIVFDEIIIYLPVVALIY